MRHRTYRRLLMLLSMFLLLTMVNMNGSPASASIDCDWCFATCCSAFIDCKEFNSPLYQCFTGLLTPCKNDCISNGCVYDSARHSCN